MHCWAFPKIQSTLSEKFTCDFEWRWIIPLASYQTGVVEPLIRTVRQALNSVWQKRELTEEQCRRFLAEITCIVNIRPLDPSSVDIWEEPLTTPNDILIVKQSLPPQLEQEVRGNPRQMLRIVQRRVGEFWTCSIKYFAPTLPQRDKWFRKRENV